MKTLNLSHIERVLIIAAPGIGDSFLATPLVHSILDVNPRIKIDFLVREGRAAYLRECSAINEVFEYSYRSKIVSYLAMVRRVFRKYDVAISTSSSDRYVLCTFYASKRRFGLVPKESLKSYWKRLLLHGVVEEDSSVPASELSLRLVDRLGIPRVNAFLFPTSKEIHLDTKGLPLALIHTLPMGKWKEWPLEHWIEVVTHVQALGFYVVLTGGPGVKEKEYNDKLLSLLSDKEHIASMVGETSFSELCWLFDRAHFFVGIDTVTSHLAAAKELPMTVIFGGVNHVKWGPRPNGYDVANGWYSKENGAQQIRNVCAFKANCTCQKGQYDCRGESMIPRCLKELSAQEVCKKIDEQVRGLSVLALSKQKTSA